MNKSMLDFHLSKVGGVVIHLTFISEKKNKSSDSWVRDDFDRVINFYQSVQIYFEENR
jgi:hypothetical protein